MGTRVRITLVMSPWARTLIVAGLATLSAALPASVANGAVRATQIASFETPVYVTAPPEDPHRLFVVEKGGTLRVVRDGVKLPDPFIDITPLVQSNDAEQGFLSLAFAPDYGTSGKAYLYYTE